MLKNLFRISVVLYIGIQIVFFTVAFTYPNETMAFYEETQTTITTAIERCGQ